MSVFALFFLWLAALRRGGLTVREAGLFILGLVVETIEQTEAMSPAELARLHGWAAWAEWAARRADPRNAIHLKGRGDGSGAALIARVVAAIRVLQGAPLKAPRRRARFGARHRRLVARLDVRVRALAAAPARASFDTS